MGKTTVLRMFASLGAKTIEADEIVSCLLERPDVLEKIRLLLGDGVFDSSGALIKGRVSDMIFADSRLRKGLEQILHPIVIKEIERQAAGAAGVVVVEVPLLFEGGYETMFQKTITVYTDEETALSRLKAKGISAEDARRRLNVQMPVSEKIMRSDFSIDNSHSLERTFAQVKAIYEKLHENY